MTEQSVFENLEPQDGFRVEKFELGQLEISLQLGVKVGGLWHRSDTRALTVEIWTARTPTQADHGNRARARLLAEAVCRYFTTGGSWPEFKNMVTAMSEVIPGGMNYPGYHLFDAYSDTEGAFTSIWVKDGTDQVVRWVEDSFIDTSLTLHDLQRELEGDEAPASGFGTDSGYHLTALPTDEDNGASAEDAGPGVAEVPGSDVEGGDVQRPDRHAVGDAAQDSAARDSV